MRSLPVSSPVPPPLIYLQDSNSSRRLQEITGALISVFPLSTSKTARQQRHFPYISEYTSAIVHLPGLETSEADALSRPISSYAPGLIEPSSDPGSIPSTSFALSPLEPCSKLSSNLSCISTSNKLKPVSLPRTPILNDSPYLHRYS